MYEGGDARGKTPFADVGIEGGASRQLLVEINTRDITVPDSNRRMTHVRLKK